MSPITIGILFFTMTIGGALVGILLRSNLPERHLNAESEATIKLGIGLIATMTALVLGLVTASAKSSYDLIDSAVKQTAVDVMTLDRTLARYGPESAQTRATLREATAAGIRQHWPEISSPTSRPGMSSLTQGTEMMVQQIGALPEQDDDQRWLKSRALDLGEKLLGSRWIVISSIGTSIPVPFLVVLAFWLLIIFVSFGLFAPKNGTVISVLFVCAMSAASAIFLILEMDGAFSGLIRISADPLNYALTHIEE